MERQGGVGSLDRSLGWYGAVVADGIGRCAARVLEQLLRWQEVASQRRRLLEMDDRTLRDLGLSRADVEQEAGRPFWDDGSRPWWPRF